MDSAPITNMQIQHSMIAIEADLSQIVQLLRQLATQGFVIEPKGVSYVESMVFATSLKVSALSSAVSARLREYAEVMASVDTAMTMAADEDRRMLNLLNVISRSISVMQTSMSERVGPEEETAHPGNVVAFPSHALAQPGPAPEGGAA